MYVTKDLKPKIAFSYCRISHVLCIICNFIFSFFFYFDHQTYWSSTSCII